jgi:hypothetical protein
MFAVEFIQNGHVATTDDTDCAHDRRWRRQLILTIVGGRGRSCCDFSTVHTYWQSVHL